MNSFLTRSPKVCSHVENRFSAEKTEIAALAFCEGSEHQ